MAQRCSAHGVDAGDEPGPRTHTALLLDQRRGARDVGDASPRAGEDRVAHRLPGRLERVPVPFPDGPLDISVTSASRYAADYFFEVAHRGGSAGLRRRARRSGARADVHRGVAWPQGLPVGQRSRGPAVAGLARCGGQSLPRDPGRSVPDPARARRPRRERREVVDRGLHAPRARPVRGERRLRDRDARCPRGRPRGRAAAVAGRGARPVAARGGRPHARAPRPHRIRLGQNGAGAAQC